MNNHFAVGIIPARYGSERLPGKPMADINGKTMITRVVEQAEKAGKLDLVIVATDDERIAEHLQGSGKRVVMTDRSIKTGTDRCFAALEGIDCTIAVNIQGDEPLLDPLTIDALIEELSVDTDAVCATPVIKISEVNDAGDPSVVKAVFDKNGYALYFSRSQIPFPRYSKPFYYRHQGIYAYRYDFLKKFVRFEMSELEITESLEQLRILENGYKIKCVKTESFSQGVDTESDLEEVRNIIISKEGLR